MPDTRDPQCKAVKYDADLPSVSVVIIFTNEAWTPLLRTVWSVLDKTPPEHLHEIILVDDFSDKKHLGGKLERYTRSSSSVQQFKFWRQCHTVQGFCIKVGLSCVFGF